MEYLVRKGSEQKKIENQKKLERKSYEGTFLLRRKAKAEILKIKEVWGDVRKWAMQKDPKLERREKENETSGEDK